MPEEELKLSTNKKIGLFFLIGIFIGASSMYYWESKHEYRSPDELAYYLEGILFNGSNLDEIEQPHLKALIMNDKTSILEVKHVYELYNRGGLMHSLLAAQMNQICYKKQWKE